MAKFEEKIMPVSGEFAGKPLSFSGVIGKKVKAPVKKAEEYWRMLGPGLTTGAADDDPSGIATYSQAGAKYGFQFLWFAPFTFPLMAVVQEMCARIGLVTGEGLAANIRDRYSRKVIAFCTALLFIANTFNIGADLGAMAKATQLLFPSLWFGALLVAFTAASLLFQIFTTYEKYAKYLKWLSLTLLSYVFSAFAINLDWKEVLVHAVVPSLSFTKEHFLLIAAVLGTTISPYLFFWQTSQEVEKDILQGSGPERSSEELKTRIKEMRIDVWSGMFLSNLVMFFIIAASAATLFANGITTIATAAEAAEALRPFAGNAAYILFTVGIIGMGLLAVPVLAGSASYAVAENFGWPQGLYRKFREGTAFYAVIILSMVIGLLTNFIGMDPFKALIYSAVVNALVAPVVLVLIVQISANKRIMGDQANHPAVTAIGWLITGLMILVALGTIYSLL